MEELVSRSDLSNVLKSTKNYIDRNVNGAVVSASNSAKSASEAQGAAESAEASARQARESAQKSEALFDGINEAMKNLPDGQATTAMVAKHEAMLPGKIDNGENTVKSTNIDGSYNTTPVFKKFKDAVLVTNKYFVNPSAGSSQDHDYVYFPLAGVDTISIAVSAFPTGRARINLFSGDGTNGFVDYWDYTSVNDTYLNFVDKGDEYYTYNVAKLLEAHPTAKTICFNLKAGVYETSNALGYFYSESKKSLDWLKVGMGNLDEGLAGDINALRTLAPAETLSNDLQKENQAVASRIKALKNAVGNVFSLSIITDIHVNNEGTYGMPVQMRRTMACIKAVNRETPSDGVMCLGDMLEGNSLYYYNSLVANRVIRDLYDRMYEISNNAYMLLGNHDGVRSRVPNLADGIDFLGDSSVTRGYSSDNNPRPYFYFDNETAKVRCLCLACPFLDTDNQEGWMFDDRQISWVASVLNNTPNGYHVIVFCHIQPYENEVLNQERTARLIGVLNAFNNHASYSNGGVSVNFSSKTGTKIVAWVCGHTHYDAVFYPGGKAIYQKSDGQYNLPSGKHNMTDVTTSFPIIVIGRSAYSYDDEKVNAINGVTYCVTPKRRFEQVNEGLWDTLVYNKDHGVITMVRHGAKGSVNVNANGDRVISV